MAVKIDKIQLLYGLERDWERINPVLLMGEPGLVLDDDTNIPLYMKVGNGVLRFTELPVLGGGASIPETDFYSKEQIDELLEAISESIDSGITELGTSIESIEGRLSQAEDGLSAVESVIPGIATYEKAP